MMSILKDFDKLNYRRKFKGHPLLNCGLEEKMFYLRGLGLVMAVDGENHDTEQEYIKNLINFLELDDKVFNDILDFIKQKNKVDCLEELVNLLADHPLLKIAFMVDAVILTERDGVVKDEENNIVEQFAKHLSVSANQMDEIRRKAEENNYSPCTEGFILVEGGSFLMGSNESESNDNERFVHKVTLDSFYIGKYPITQREYKDITGHNPSNNQSDDHPVENVNWFEAVIYCNRRSEKEGLELYYEITDIYVSSEELTATVSIKGGFGYRLPTEAEWEYAARGGKKRKQVFRYSGSDNLDDVGWYAANSKHKTHQVGKKKPNELMIYDMSGNVLEWCWDWYESDYYCKSPEKNPLGSNNGSKSSYPSHKYRVLRGGSFYLGMKYCRNACRYINFDIYSSSNNSAEHKRSRDVGFRLARTKE